MIVLLYVLIASVLCLALLILLIVLLRGMEKDALDIWLGFLKFFLGTFVIGLLGYFAKVSFDNRQMAIMESDQIGKYVANAMLDDIEPRLRFAEYFSTVLPENHKTGWEDYYNKLLKEEEDTSNKQDSVNIDKTKASVLEKEVDKLSKSENVEDSAVQIEINKKLDTLNSLYNSIEVKQKSINESARIIPDSVKIKASATIANPDDFITCKAVEKLIPYYRTSTFQRNNKVYVHAYIQSPKLETITIIWRDYKGKEINRNVSNISVSIGRGYRLFDHIRPTSAGGYSVEMLNQAGTVIGFKEFTVTD